MTPCKRITDPTFAYTNAAKSSEPGYLADKFARIRAELAKQAALIDRQEKETGVVAMRKRKA